MKRYIAGLVCAAACLPALAAEGRWTEGFGQGNLEYFIDKSNIRLYIGCPTKEGGTDASSVSLSQVNNGKGIQSFTITVNGITYDGPFDANSRVGTNSFISLLDSLRKGDAVVKFGGKTVTFPRSNAAKVLPKYGKGFSCNVM